MNLLPTNSDSVHVVRKFEAVLLQLPQVELETIHNIWAGCYARTIRIPKGIIITGAQIKIPTMLIVSGDVLIGGVGRFTGYHVLEGNIGRKNAFQALEDTWLTMIFATDNTIIEDVENEFTDEAHRLMTRK